MTLDRAAANDRAWQADRVTTRSGVVIPVRATARRPLWEQLPPAVRSLVQQQAGAVVLRASSAGTGFTPGFASRLDLDDGRRTFVKAASSADDRLHGWPLSDAYRDEVRKLAALPSGIGAPAVLWHRDVEIADERWIVVGFQYVDGAPPRRPWRLDQLQLVLDKLIDVADALAVVPVELDLETVSAEILDGYADRLAAVRRREGASEWLDRVDELCTDAHDLLAGDNIVHMDLRDDNILIGPEGDVWIVDWNWTVMGPPWVDLVCLLLSARGDGLDAEGLLREHPLSREAEPGAIDALLAVLWSFWAVAATHPVPSHSPHVRHHQKWYLETTESWLRERLSSR